MKKILFSTLLTIFLITNLISEENSTIELNITIEDSNLSDLSEDELLAEFMKLDEEIEEAQEKTKNLEKLEKTVDDLASTLNIEN